MNSVLTETVTEIVEFRKGGQLNRNVRWVYNNEAIEVVKTTSINCNWSSIIQVHGTK